MKCEGNANVLSIILISLMVHKQMKFTWKWNVILSCSPGITCAVIKDSVALLVNYIENLGNLICGFSVVLTP